MTANLLKNIDVASLTQEAMMLNIFELDEESKNKFSMDDAAYLIANENSFYNSARTPREIPPSKADIKYWAAVKKEFVTLLCTDDKRYSKLRNKLKTTSNLSIGYIAAKFAPQLGVESKAIVGFCAVCAYFALKIHKEAFCQKMAEEET